MRRALRGALTFSLRGAETGGEAGCWSVPLEALVRAGLAHGLTLYSEEESVLYAVGTAQCNLRPQAA
jgi:hypothetical protein